MNSLSLFFSFSRYDIYTHEKISHEGVLNVRVSPDRIPIYQRGGSIIPRKDRVRRSSPLMHDDPYTLRVALDSSGAASGTLFIDDGQGYDYRDGKSLYVQFSYSSGKLTGHQLKQPGYETGSWLEKVLFVGWTGAEPASATLRTPTGGEQRLQTSLDSAAKVLTVRKPGVNMAEEWEISFA